MQFYIWIIINIVIVYLMVSKKKGVSVPIESPLSRNEKIIIWVLCFFNPVLTGAILYYGWKKLLPVKARQANSISLWMFLIQVVVGVTVGFLIGRYL